ncbi:MAG: VIT1/CCC1 family protein [Endomicrobia bacterium]|nr:VIT1/CCC1 family protein [Endomicrobiia bacterium]
MKNLDIINIITKYQCDEETASVVYRLIAVKVKDPRDKETLLKISDQEREHAAVWENYSGRHMPASRFKITWHILLSYVMGYTFLIKFLNRRVRETVKCYKILEKDIPEISEIICRKEEHERILIDMLDEDRLKYVGAMVLGLNDAIVEITGTLAGLTFALANTKIIALVGIITGAAATLSMAAAKYLAERADGNSKALKASAYTGTAYLITVILLVIPYLLFPKDMYIAAFAVMMTAAILIILFFSYYISVAKSLPFIKRFAEMACISIGVSVIAFIIGIAAKSLLGIEI